MKLWKISQDVNEDYDTYDSAVVAAETEEDARCISPSGAKLENGQWGERYGAWAKFPSQVNVKYIGEAAVGIGSGVIVASFNAG